MSVRVVMNIQGFYDLRRNPNVVAFEEAAANRLAEAANSAGKGTYAVGSQQGMRRPQGRWRTSVVTADAKAMASNAKHNTLLNALGQSGISG